MLIIMIIMSIRMIYRFDGLTRDGGVVRVKYAPEAQGSAGGLIFHDLRAGFDARRCDQFSMNYLTSSSVSLIVPACVIPFVIFSTLL
jgi:hypothetical protein